MQGFHLRTQGYKADLGNKTCLEFFSVLTLYVLQTLLQISGLKWLSKLCSLCVQSRIRCWLQGCLEYKAELRA